jgi:hypothetical protein
VQGFAGEWSGGRDISAMTFYGGAITIGLICLVAALVARLRR